MELEVVAEDSTLPEARTIPDPNLIPTIPREEVERQTHNTKVICRRPAGSQGSAVLREGTGTQCFGRRISASEIHKVRTGIRDRQ